MTIELRSTENRQHCNTIKVKTEQGSMFLHIETDRPCVVTGFSIETRPTFKRSTLGQFIKQLKYEESKLVQAGGE